MKNRKYAPEEVDAFIETAQIMGVGPAMRHLGYPTWPTAAKWFKEKDLELPTVDSLQERAAGLRTFYGDTEKKYAAQRNIERIVQALEQDQLDADAIKKLSDALHKAVQTFNLIDGKSTYIQETRTKDGSELEIMDMIGQMKAENALKEKEFNALG